MYYFFQHTFLSKRKAAYDGAAAMSLFALVEATLRVVHELHFFFRFHDEGPTETNEDGGERLPVPLGVFTDCSDKSGSLFGTVIKPDMVTDLEISRDFCLSHFFHVERVTEQLGEQRSVWGS